MFLFWCLFCFLRPTTDEKIQSPPSSVKLKIPQLLLGAQRHHWASACICLLHSFSQDPLCVFSNWLGTLQRSPPPPAVCFICDDHTSLTPTEMSKAAMCRTQNRRTLILDVTIIVLIWILLHFACHHFFLQVCVPLHSGQNGTACDRLWWVFHSFQPRSMAASWLHTANLRVI